MSVAALHTGAHPYGRFTASYPADEFGRGWTGFLWLALFMLTLPTLKLPLVVELRLGQLVLVLGFALLALRDLTNGRLHWGVLLALVGCGLLLCAISYSAPYPKFKQAVFFVKYLFLFPAAFYLGARLFSGLPAARTAAVLETVLFTACGLAVLLEFYPIPALIHERPEGLADGLKGSFWEQGEFAFFIGVFLLASIALRAGYDAWPQRRWPLVPVYLLALGCALASENRTVWLGLVVALILAGLLYRPPGADPRVARRWGLRLIAVAVVALTALLTYNAYLPVDDKLISMNLLELKWETERGAALRAAADLLARHPWLGHGFGYVEAYFGTRAIGVVGLGSGVAQIFNSYIDIWVAVGVPGLVYALALIWIVFDRRVLFPTFVVAFLFVSANINPVAQHEYYYIFLGGAYALSRWRGGAPAETYPQKEVFP